MHAILLPIIVVDERTEKLVNSKIRRKNGYYFACRRTSYLLDYLCIIYINYNAFSVGGKWKQKRNHLCIENGSVCNKVNTSYISNVYYHCYVRNNLPIFVYWMSNHPDVYYYYYYSIVSIKYSSNENVSNHASKRLLL